MSPGSLSKSQSLHDELIKISIPTAIA